LVTPNVVHAKPDEDRFKRMQTIIAVLIIAMRTEGSYYHIKFFLSLALDPYPTPAHDRIAGQERAALPTAALQNAIQLDWIPASHPRRQAATLQDL
jgi:hypothetical protein